VVSIAAQGDELHHIALVRRHIDVRRLGCRCDEVRLAAFSIPNSLAGSDRTMKTARLPHAGVKVMEDIWVDLSDRISDPRVVLDPVIPRNCRAWAAQFARQANWRASAKPRRTARFPVCFMVPPRSIAAGILATDMSVRATWATGRRSPLLLVTLIAAPRLRYGARAKPMPSGLPRYNSRKIAQSSSKPPIIWRSA
jgi:hypothetical protein